MLSLFSLNIPVHTNHPVFALLSAAVISFTPSLAPPPPPPEPKPVQWDDLCCRFQIEAPTVHYSGEVFTVQRAPRWARLNFSNTYYHLLLEAFC